MLKTAKMTILDVTKGKTYQVTPTDDSEKYFKLRGDSGEMIIRHESLFEDKSK